MGDMSKEPSMEEILSSIKRIIAEEGEEAARAAPRAPRRGTDPVPVSSGPDVSDSISLVSAALEDDDVLGELPPGAISAQAEEVLELTDAIAMEDVMAPTPAPSPRAPEKAVSKAKATAKSVADAAPTTVKTEAGAPETILSVESEVAARHSLSALSSMVVKPAEGGDNTLDALVRSMLRPMLKEWLDAQLPEMVEAMVAKEIARITGRGI